MFVRNNITHLLLNLCELSCAVINSGTVIDVRQNVEIVTWKVLLVLQYAIHHLAWYFMI